MKKRTMKHIHEGKGAQPSHPSKAKFAETMKGLEGEYRGMGKGGNGAKRRRDKRLEGKAM